MVAPARSGRPGARAAAVEDIAADEARCPFCEGREAATPPETFALGPSGRVADASGWWVRVVPNKFPAFGPWQSGGERSSPLFARRPARGRQEVVIHSPRHLRSLAELSGRELACVAQAWQARGRAAHEEGYAYVQALVNEGRLAGASLLHSHSQLLCLSDEPPAVAAKRQEQAAAGSRCLLCQLVEQELGRRLRVVAERDGLVLLCPFAGRQPYEMLVAPRACESDPFTSDSLGPALILAAEGLRRLRSAEGDVPVNLWLHADGHWHIEIVPRLAALAGVELGAGYYVNVLAPESAAGILREA